MTNRNSTPPIDRHILIGVSNIYNLLATIDQVFGELRHCFPALTKMTTRPRLGTNVTYRTHPALLTAVDSTRHVHLVIGSNPLAGARCTKSLEVGAIVKLIAPAEAELHYGLKQRIDQKEVEWVQRDFHEDDLKTLGRTEVDHVVDCVFVTLGPKHPLSAHNRLNDIASTLCSLLYQVHGYPHFAEDYEYLSTWQTHPACQPLPYYRHTQTGLYRSA